MLRGVLLWALLFAVYAATVGGVRLAEPAADLALALALTSSAQGFALPQRTVLVGEIGLAGEIRPVAGVNRRLAEASRLGFTTASTRRVRSRSLS